MKKERKKERKADYLAVYMSFSLYHEFSKRKEHSGEKSKE